MAIRNVTPPAGSGGDHSNPASAGPAPTTQTPHSVGVGEGGAQNIEDWLAALLLDSYRKGIITKAEMDTYKASVANQMMSVVKSTAKQLNLPIGVILQGSYLDDKGVFHIYIGSRDGKDTHITMDQSGNTNIESGEKGLTLPEGSDPADRDGDGGKKVTADDYLNSLPTSIEPTKEVRQLAEQAADQKWEDWKWQEKLTETDTYADRMSIVYKSQLQAWNMDITGNLGGLIDTAIDRDYSTEEFNYWLRQTPEYRQRFKGIWQKGELVMTEAEYIAAEHEYQLLGKKYGYPVGANVVANNIRKGIDSADFEERLQAVDRLKEYKPALQEFNEVARRAGLVKGKLSKEELYRFVRGEAPAAWSKLWEEATLRSAARTQGIQIGQGKAGPVGQLSNKVVKGILKRTDGEMSPEEMDANWTEVADNLLNTMPLSKIYGLGLSEGEIAQAAFGGPRAAGARQKIKRILATDESFSDETRAAPGLGVGAGSQATEATASRRRGY